MDIGFITGHIGSAGLKPSGQFGGGEMHTFAFLAALSDHYKVTAITPNYFYPAFDSAAEYGYDLTGLEWKPIGPNREWVSKFDVMIAKDHGQLHPPVCHRNILSVFFPQHPMWDVSGYDTILANSGYTAEWIKRYWKQDATVIYPPVPIDNVREVAGDYRKKNQIVNIGRFFRVPDGNNKNHLVVVDAFKRLMLPDWELVLIGANQDSVYLEEVQAAIGNDQRIKIFHDLPRAEYIKTLAESQFIWAATGFAEGAEHIPPSSREHFGIFTVEGAAVNTLPMVHNSGGSPEGPAMAWDTPDDLVRNTLKYINNSNELGRALAHVTADLSPYDFATLKDKLIEVIERPVMMLPEEGHRKIFVSAPARESITLGMVSDSAEKTTGFGMVTRGLGTRLSEMGYQVKVLGLQDPHVGPPNYVDELYTWRAWPGENYANLLGRFVKEEGINVLYANYDLGNVRVIADTLYNGGFELPIIAYLPVEGAPVIPQMIDTIRMIKLFNGEVILYTDFAVREVLKAGGPQCKYAHHGIDHADFIAPTYEKAMDSRRALGWEDNFVIVYTGRNKRSKNHLVLLDTIEILKKRGHDDVVAYIHADPFDHMANSSVPLIDAAMVRDIYDIVHYPIDLQEQANGVPYAGERNITAERTDDPRALRDIVISTMNYMERMWLAHPRGAFVNTSLAEGWGLPGVEALMMGLPVISIDDYGVQREVLGPAPIWVPPTHTEYWNTCAILRQGDPNDLADAVVALKEGEGGLNHVTLMEEGVEWASQYTWDKTAKVIDEAILRRVSI
jgi:glycosyltransferase involved in cell wall biosynthesis